MSISSRLRRVLLVISLLSLPALAAGQESLAPPAPIRLTVHSGVLDEDRVAWVRTPRSYADGKGSYPVLYLTDGDMHINEIGNTIDFLADNRRIPELIVVGIANADRARDLAPAQGGDEFLRFVESELMPEVEKRYRTQPFRVFAGHSLGGLLVVHALAARPALFNAYIAVSPSLQDGKEAELRRVENS